jgi:hypothetical protein
MTQAQESELVKSLDDSPEIPRNEFGRFEEFQSREPAASVQVREYVIVAHSHVDVAG